MAAQINSQMPRFVADKVQAALNEHGKPVKGSRIHLVGVAYKRDVSDIRASRSRPDFFLAMSRSEYSYTPV